MTFTFDPLQAAFVVMWLLGAWRMTREWYSDGDFVPPWFAGIICLFFWPLFVGIDICILGIRVRRRR